MAKKSSTWGGRRTPRPGKTMGPDPKPPDEKFVTRRISLPPELDKWLRANVQGSISGFISNLIQEHIKRIEK